MQVRALGRLSSPADRAAFVRCLRRIAQDVGYGELTIAFGQGRVCDARLTAKVHAAKDSELESVVETLLPLDMRPRPESET